MCVARSSSSISFFFFNDTATTEIYTLSLHDALPIFTINFKKQTDGAATALLSHNGSINTIFMSDPGLPGGDRKSTRLNSSHSQISYAVFCLKKKKIKKYTNHP